MSRLGFAQEQVDGMELWVIAAVLQGGAPSEDADPSGEGVAMTEDDFHRRSLDVIRQRLAAAGMDGSPTAADGAPSMTP